MDFPGTKASLANRLDNFCARPVGFGHNGVRSKPAEVVGFGRFFLTGGILNTSRRLTIREVKHRSGHRNGKSEIGNFRIFEFLELCVCLFINVLGEVTTVALLLELEHEWGRAGSG